ncbi:hypothetical protein NDU88_000957 [Pleurodeles waltl]|uniref:Uncharacterized protein n=1 Tax=Pleurodeles waltl TaxID=8319 RepID=A0AAV7SYL6_PLEWA|nr:hypothetical protein NDU88_000957 [Pleurodeles waltl]
MGGRGLAAGQDGRHYVRLCRAAGRLSCLFPLKGGAGGGALRHGPGPCARSGGRGACGVPLPANILCREQENILVAYSRLDRAAALVDSAALRMPRHCRPCGSGAAGGLRALAAWWRRRAREELS